MTEKTATFILSRETTMARTKSENLTINYIFHDQDFLYVEKSGIEEQRNKEQSRGQSSHSKEDEVRVPNQKETDQER